MTVAGLPRLSLTRASKFAWTVLLMLASAAHASPMADWLKNAPLMLAKVYPIVDALPPTPPTDLSSLSDAAAAFEQHMRAFQKAKDEASFPIWPPSADPWPLEWTVREMYWLKEAREQVAAARKARPSASSLDLFGEGVQLMLSQIPHYESLLARLDKEGEAARDAIGQDCVRHQIEYDRQKAVLDSTPSGVDHLYFMYLRRFMSPSHEAERGQMCLRLAPIQLDGLRQAQALSGTGQANASPSPSTATVSSPATERSPDTPTGAQAAQAPQPPAPQPPQVASAPPQPAPSTVPPQTLAANAGSTTQADRNTVPPRLRTLQTLTVSPVVQPPLPEAVRRAEVLYRRIVLVGGDHEAKLQVSVNADGTPYGAIGRMDQGYRALLKSFSSCNEGERNPYQVVVTQGRRSDGVLRYQGWWTGCAPSDGVITFADGSRWAGAVKGGAETGAPLPLPDFETGGLRVFSDGTAVYWQGGRERLWLSPKYLYGGGDTKETEYAFWRHADQSGDAELTQTRTGWRWHGAHDGAWPTGEGYWVDREGYVRLHGRIAEGQRTQSPWFGLSLAAPVRVERLAPVATTEVASGLLPAGEYRFDRPLGPTISGLPQGHPSAALLTNARRDPRCGLSDGALADLPAGWQPWWPSCRLVAGTSRTWVVDAYAPDLRWQMILGGERLDDGRPGAPTWRLLASLDEGDQWIARAFTSDPVLAPVGQALQADAQGRTVYRGGFVGLTPDGPGECAAPNGGFESCRWARGERVDTLQLARLRQAEEERLRQEQAEAERRRQQAMAYDEAYEREERVRREAEQAQRANRGVNWGQVLNDVATSMRQNSGTSPSFPIPSAPTPSTRPSSPTSPPAAKSHRADRCTQLWSQFAGESLRIAECVGSPQAYPSARAMRDAEARCEAQEAARTRSARQQYAAECNTHGGGAGAR